MQSSILHDFLISRLGSDSTGHDVHHAERVLANARSLAQLEGTPCDNEVLEAAALLHDVMDHKFVEPSESERLRAQLELVLKQAGLDEPQRDHIFAIWAAMGFRGKDARPEMPSLEGKLLLDADRLDAMGAIGIARCFAYGGKKGRPLYDPAEQAMDFADMESYRAHAGSSLAHFHEKLFHLRTQMLTEAARQVAEKRHRFMEEFVDRFKREWAGTDL